MCAEELADTQALALHVFLVVSSIPGPVCRADRELRPEVGSRGNLPTTSRRGVSVVFPAGASITIAAKR